MIAWSRLGGEGDEEAMTGEELHETLCNIPNVTGVDIQALPKAQRATVTLYVGELWEVPTVMVEAERIAEEVVPMGFILDVVCKIR